MSRWRLTLLGGVALIILVAMLTRGATTDEVAGPGEGVGPGEAGQEGGGDGGDIGDGGGGDGGGTTMDEFRDEAYFVYRQLSGDGSLTVEVTSQEDTDGWAQAGIMLRKNLDWGASNVALFLTPDHGVRLQSRFFDEVAGSRSQAPRWLRLVRSGGTVTGYESPDGDAWAEVGSVEVPDLPTDLEVGLFVNSPDEVVLERTFAGESVGMRPALGEATFDHVTLEAGGDPAVTFDGWQGYDAGMFPGLGDVSEADGVFTVRGTGVLGERQDDPFRSDIIADGLRSAIIGMIAFAVVAVLFITSEHRRGMIRTSYTASPRRGRVLAAKAVVIGGVTFLAGLVSAAVAFLIIQPKLKTTFYGTGGEDLPSLVDGTVLRAVVGTAVLLACVAVLSLAVGALLRRSAPAITLVVLLLVLPQILLTGFPLSVEKWFTRLTPLAGFSVQETTHRYDTAIGPLAGLAVLGAYTAVAFGAALWVTRRRDA